MDLREYEPVREKTNNLGFRPGPTQTGLYRHRSGLKALRYGSKKTRHCTVCIAKKALISCAVNGSSVIEEIGLN